MLSTTDGAHIWHRGQTSPDHQILLTRCWLHSAAGDAPAIRRSLHPSFRAPLAAKTLRTLSQQQCGSSSGAQQLSCHRSLLEPSMHHTLGRLGSNGSLARACRLLPPARVSATAPNRRCSRTTTMAAAGEAIETQQAIVTAAAEAAEAQAAPQAPQQQQQQPDAGDGSSSVQAPPAVKKKVKRNVALHVGYVGTNYSGGLWLQTQQRHSLKPCVLAPLFGSCCH